MTKEEKELLIKDLCARLPYGTKVCYRLSDKDKYTTETLSGHMLDYFNENSIIEVKPYLRPMSSMTDEEFKTYEYFLDEDGLIDCSVDVYVDWLLEGYFDFRGLIPKGLALEAPEGMYVIK